ncbi:fatty-acyl-CoA synthase [Salsuginibacillus halophilus]|uniref:Fatty-acyl-CoA synthase n=1 Tax=Salsuginibacillus halophilus TaxID=517424 RepID=A0A2P8HQI2_9BACI|nr:long-chain-fatty-acid--CoA ligase [Salsuginibacillus halophilus]PSL48483.1 fatty-acyl-CoA synthase [Salsuginibacillus halophilus]
MHVPLVVTDFLDRAVQLYAQKTAVIDGNWRLTYTDVYHRVQQLSRGLKALQIEKGDKVAYLAPNSTEMYEGFYGVFQVGGVMTPLNTRLTPDDYIFILNHSESKVLFVDITLYERVKEIRDQLETVHTIIVHGMDEDRGQDIAYEPWLASFSEEEIEREPLEETDIASLLYTSGTTGNPKGVMLSHRSNYLHALTTMHHLRVSDQDTLIHILPMFHVNGWGSPFYYTANGATQVMQRQMDPAEIFKKIEAEGVTVAHMAPTVLNMLLEHDALSDAPLKLTQDVRVVIAGSAPPPAFVKRVEEDLGWEFIQVYGMTEISPLITTSQINTEVADKSKEEKQRLKAKTGYAMIGSNVRVVDEDGSDVPWDGASIGEIVTRSNNVMEGYWKNPEATNETIKNGYLHTGDMANVDSDGYIEIVDRKKDVIISGGENISSIEVEGCLYEHPDVREAAVISAPHEKWGEVPHAIVVLREGSEVTEEDLMNFARENMAKFKAPKGISFMEELPKTASGKIQKVQLRKPFWEESGRMVN